MRWKTIGFLGAAGFGLQWGALSISFQRYMLPVTGFVHSTPRSFGALPTGRSGSGRFLLPVDDKEAFWIGLSSAGGIYYLGLVVCLHDGRRIQLCDKAQIPPVKRVFGWPAGRRHCVLSRTGAGRTPSVESILFDAECATGAPRARREATLLLTPYAAYAFATSRRPPEHIDDSSGYGGQLLP
jgi:hypothetical protein